MTRNELINDLVCVRSIIQKIINVTERQVSIVANFRETGAKIETTGVKSQTKIIVVALMIITAFVLGLLNGWVTALVYCGCMAFLYYKRHKKSKLKILAGAYVVFYLLSFIELAWSSISTGNIGLAVILMILLAVSVFGIVTIIKLKNADTERKNVRINKHNMAVQTQYDETVQQLAALKNELRNYGNGWYPPKYYSLEAVNFFIDVIQNFQANSMTEAIQQFVQTQQFNQLMQSQRTLIQLGQQQVVNQQAMLRELKFANVLNMQNLALQFGTIDAINSNTAAVNNASYRSSYDTNRVIDTMNKFKH